jgi:FixJ family two-component response regulator
VQDDPIIYVIDDDDSLRAAMESLFRSVGLTCEGHASVADFLADPRDDVPGCLVLDVRMPGMSGLDFQDRLDELGIGLPAILISGHGDIPMSVRAMKAGAVDFLVKPFRDQDMLDAVAVAIARDRTQRAEAVDHAALHARHATLSPREQQVMSLVSAGKLNKQVAFALGLSEVTVKIHRGAAMRKMGARTLPDLVRMAEKLGVGAA